MADTKKIGFTPTPRRSGPSPVVGPRTIPKPSNPQKGSFPVHTVKNEGQYVAGRSGPIRG